MKQHSYLAIGFAAVFILMNGCSSAQVNLVDAGAVQLHLTSTHPVDVKRATVVKEGNDVIISGIVERERQRGLWIRGHVDIVVMNSDGTPLLERHARLQLRRANRYSWQGWFSQRVTLELPDVSCVEITHHQGDHEEG